MSATIHKTIVIDGVTYNLMRANETPEEGEETCKYYRKMEEDKQ